jgi:hypothetical protein
MLATGRRRHRPKPPTPTPISAAESPRAFRSADTPPVTFMPPTAAAAALALTTVTAARPVALGGARRRSVSVDHVARRRRRRRPAPPIADQDRAVASRRPMVIPPDTLRPPAPPPPPTGSGPVRPSDSSRPSVVDVAGDLCLETTAGVHRRSRPIRRCPRRHCRDAVAGRRDRQLAVTMSRPPDPPPPPIALRDHGRANGPRPGCRPPVGSTSPESERRRCWPALKTYLARRSPAVASRAADADADIHSAGPR